MSYSVAQLSKDEEKKIKEIETEMGLVLIAYKNEETSEIKHDPLAH